jgi:predicted nucleotidyltransferase
MSLPPVALTAVRAFRDAVAESFGDRVADLRVFGSYARGDWREGSDLDVAIVVAGLTEPERRQVFDLAWDVYTRTLVRISPLALSDREWGTMLAREHRIALDIEREGVRP